MKKVIRVTLIVIGIIVLLSGITIGGMAFVISSNNTYKGDTANTMAGKDTTSGKALLVYQPSGRNTSASIADQIAKGLIDAGYEVTVSYPGKHMSPDVKDYSVVVLGSPVYMGKISDVLTNYMKNLQNAAGKKIAIYSVGMSLETPELDSAQKNLNSVVFEKKVKFRGDHRDNLDAAYKFGLEIGKE